MENPKSISTMPEAAQWLSDRTGVTWDSGRVMDFALKEMLRSVVDAMERDVLLCVLPPSGAEYGFRRFDIDTASVKVTRLDPLDIAPLSLTEYESVLQLVAGGSIPMPVHPIGEPWQGEDELIIFAKEVPIVSADAVRIWARDLVRLADRFESQNPAPATHDVTPAPVVAVGPLVEPDKAGPVEDGLLTKEIAVIFDGVNGWDVVRWRKNLSASKWLHPARTALGGAGGASSVWNPLTLAQLMHSKTKGDKAREQVMKAFNSRFNRHPALLPWRDAFNEYFATHCTED